MDHHRALKTLATTLPLGAAAHTLDPGSRLDLGQLVAVALPRPARIEVGGRVFSADRFAMAHDSPIYGESTGPLTYFRSQMEGVTLFMPLDPQDLVFSGDVDMPERMVPDGEVRSEVRQRVYTDPRVVYLGAQEFRNVPYIRVGGL